MTAENKIVQITLGPCELCGLIKTVSVGVNDVFDYVNDRKDIQDAMPYLSRSDREMIISGLCLDCFRKTYLEDYCDEC